MREGGTGNERSWAKGGWGMGGPRGMLAQGRGSLHKAKSKLNEEAAWARFVLRSLRGSAPAV